MTWKPTKQDPCGPGCTRTGIKAPAPEPEPRPAVLRTCGSLGCGSCPPVTKWNTPGGGAKLAPDPLLEYQEASNELHHTDTRRTV